MPGALIEPRTIKAIVFPPEDIVSTESIVAMASFASSSQQEGIRTKGSFPVLPMPSKPGPGLLLPDGIENRGDTPATNAIS